MEVDISLYKVFCTVAREKSITKAAENLYISQSAVTQSIKKLENQIGDKLFARHKSGVTLTEAGKTLFLYLDDSIEKISNAYNYFSKYLQLEEGELRIGGGNALMSAIILSPLKEFCKLHPKINVLLTNEKTDSLIEMMLNGKLDVVVHFIPHNNKSNNTITTNLLSSAYCLFCSKDYYKNHFSKTTKTSEKLRMIIPKRSSSKYKIFEKLVKDLNYDQENVFEVAGTEIQNELVLDDFGIGFSNVAVLQEIKDKIKIIKKYNVSDGTIAITTLKKDSMTVATKEFLKYIKEYYDKNKIEDID